MTTDEQILRLEKLVDTIKQDFDKRLTRFEKLFAALKIVVITVVITAIVGGVIMGWWTIKEARDMINTVKP